MYKKFKNNKRKHVKKHIHWIPEAEGEFVTAHIDPDGKIIFLNKTITPTWLIEKLNNHFLSERNEGMKCQGLTI